MAKNKKQVRRTRTKLRIRKKIKGTAERPRLSVYRSNRHVYAQIIDDVSGHTIASASSFVGDIGGESPLDRSKEVGKQLADKAKGAGVERIVFDRNGYKYHGRVKALAEGAREGGLIF